MAVEEFVKDNAGAIRKFTRAHVFVADMTAPVIEKITKTGTGNDIVLDIPDTYHHIGLIKKDSGIEFTKEPDVSDVESLGYAAPTRRDVTKENVTMAFTPHETNKLVSELYYGVDLSKVAPDKTTGEVHYDLPTTPPAIYRRFLIVGEDGAGSNKYFEALFVPRGMITETDSRAFSAEDEAQYPLTMSATPDPDAGYSVRVFHGGTGFKANAEKLGWKAASGVGVGG